jgi:hypothetical protein
MGLCLSVLCASPAQAQDAVLVGEPRDTPFFRAVAAELRAIGFVAISRAELRDEAAPERWMLALRTQNAIAAVVLRQSELGGSIWVYDRVTEKLSMRPLRVRDSDTPAHLAERCVELLRASLLETALALDTPPLVSVPISVRQVVQRALQPAATRIAMASASSGREALWFGSAAIGVGWAPGGLSPAATLSISAGRFLVGPLSLSLNVWSSLGPSTVWGEEGIAEARWIAPSFAARIAAIHSERFLWDFAAGAGALVGHVVGLPARSGVQAQAEWGALAMASVSTAFAFFPVSPVGVRVAVDGVVPFGTAEVRFSGRSVARLEALWLVATVGVHIRW